MTKGTKGAGTKRGGTKHSKVNYSINIDQSNLNIKEPTKGGGGGGGGGGINNKTFRGE